MKKIIESIKVGWGAKSTNEEEKECWKYNSEYNYSLRYFVGMEMKQKRGGLACVIDDVVCVKNRFYYISEQNKYPITTVYVKVLMPFFNKVRWVDSSPSRAMKLFVEEGYLIDEKKYKSLCYKTEEYRDKFKKGMLNSYGVEANSPMLIGSIKDKISKSIQKKYGVPWFLHRGDHYNKIENILKETYGDTPEKFYLFGSSRLEADVVDFITNCKEIKVGRRLHYLSKDNSQFVFNVEDKRYSSDFYDEENGIVIEVNGDYFHCNPSVYSPEYFNEAKQMKAKQLWERDRKREVDIVREFKVKYLVVWEKDWLENRNFIEKQIINIYNEN